MIDKDEVLYHYTTIDSFNAIVSTKTLWASDCRYLNDRLELERAIELFLNEFSNGEKNALTQAFFYHRLTHCHCIFSLSRSPRVLSQWRAYGEDGRGVAIGFNRKFLSLSYPEPKSTLVECIYKDHFNFIKSLISQHSQDLDDIINMRSNFSADNDYLNEIRRKPNSLNTIFTELLRVKNSAFEEEQEVRLVFHVPVENVKTRVRNALIIPYVEYNLCENDTDKDHFWCIAPKVWLGPKSDERNLNAIRTFQQFGWVFPENLQRYDCGYL